MPEARAIACPDCGALNRVKAAGAEAEVRCGGCDRKLDLRTARHLEPAEVRYKGSARPAAAR